MKLKTNRLLIRPFLLQDLYDMHEYCAQDGVGENAGWAAHKSLEESSEVLDNWISGGCKHAIVLLENRKVIGHISIDPDSEEGRLDTRELGCALNVDYHRQGIMTEAIEATIEYLFSIDSFRYIWACCFQNNIASKGMIEKCGFRFMDEGTYYSPALKTELPSYEYRISKDEWTARLPSKDTAFRFHCLC